MKKSKRKVVVSYEANRFGDSNLLSSYKLLLSKLKQVKQIEQNIKKNREFNVVEELL